MATCLLSSIGLCVRIHSCFCKLWHNDVYNCLNTCLYAVWSTLILISCIASCSSLGLCFMSSLPKGERLCTKLVELLLIGWLREETWQCLSKGRACIEIVWGSFVSFLSLIQGEFLSFVAFLCFWAFLSSSLPFWLVCRLSCLLLVLRIFLLLDGLLKLFLPLVF
jgi:hypothetical protein